MKRSSYGERDYAFGQLMLTLRMSIGLTQAGLAERLRVSRRAVAEWEAGSSYPKAEHLKQLIVLGVRASAFPEGREAEEIRALWKAAHQKVLVDESWLAALLSQQHPRLALMGPLAVEQTSDTDQLIAPPALRPRVDWGEALAVPAFYGREGELALLSAWVVQERCRVVSVLGMGGIGKSVLVVSLMHRLAPQFEVVIWRSLRDAPAPEALLDDCLQVLDPPRSPRCRPASNDAWACCWSTCAAGVHSWCWTTWRRCWRKERARAACVQATRAMDGCCAGWPRPSTRVVCCSPRGRNRASSCPWKATGLLYAPCASQGSRETPVRSC